MKQIVRYRFMTIPSKLTGELRITIDERSAEYNSQFDGGRSTNIALFPIIAVAITRPNEIDEKGNKIRAPWNPNDSIGMTKFTFPIFINELKAMMRDMKIPELYTYQGNRLELNTKISEKYRHVFMLGNTAIEFSPVVITQPDETKVEGVKLKFNREESSVLLTLNELEALLYNLNSLNVDLLSLQLYKTYITKVSYSEGRAYRNPNPEKLIDVSNNNHPKEMDFQEFVD